MSSTADNSKLDAIIAAYVEAIERGEKPDRDQLKAAHPELAGDLARFFADSDRMQATHLHKGPPIEPTVIPQHEPKPDSFIGGRYKLLQNIGEGGMGSVWVAEQREPVKRKVAIKLIKAGMDSKQVLARFEAERQALAVMDHPNIAKVFDGGLTEHGRPYFVMEYVKGVPFTEYCDKARLSLKERLNLFIPVCQAVQHAHHKGIVHRDLKPSNILICLYDGKPVPKVIDFGLAKAMNQSLTEHSIFTGHGVMVGTPLYMSPEQAEHNNLDVDTRTDIYSLGVVLYELLTGTTPLEREQLRTAAYNEVLRLIKEVEPPRPSTRLSDPALASGRASALLVDRAAAPGVPAQRDNAAPPRADAQRLADSPPRSDGQQSSLDLIARNRSTEPRKLSLLVRGDLDWIVMKSLEKERSRRYETTNGLARDVERFLNDEPVEACPPSLAYRVKKFTRKHRGKVFAASSILTALVLGILGTAWGWHRASTAEDETREALAKVTEERDAKNEALEAEAAQRKRADEQRDLAERKMIEGILRPIGHDDEPNSAELRAFVDWAALPDSRLKLKVLEVAFKETDTALRVARRSDRTIQACVTISPTRRAAALKFLAEKQRDSSAPPAIRTAACWLTMELGSNDLPASCEAITWLAQPSSAALEARSEFSEFVEHFLRRIDSLNPQQVTHGADALIDVLETTQHWPAKCAVGSCLVSMAPKLGPAQLARIGDAVIDALVTAPNSSVLRVSVNNMMVLTPHLSSVHLLRGWDALIAALDRLDFLQGHDVIANGLAALAPRLGAEQLSSAGDALIGVLENTTGGFAVRPASVGIVAISQRLSPLQLARIGEALIAELEKTADSSVLRAATDAFGALAPLLESSQVTRGVNALIAALERTNDPKAHEAASIGLTSLAPKLNPEQVRRAGSALIAVVETSKIWEAQHAAGNAVVILASQLQADQITRCSDGLIAVLEHTSDPVEVRVAANGLVSLAPRLSPEQLSRSWDAMIRILNAKMDMIALQATRNGMVEMAPRLTPEQRIRAGDELIDVLATSIDYHTLRAAGDGLIALAPHLQSEQLMRAWDTLIATMKRTRGTASPHAIGLALLALSHGLQTEQALRGGEALVTILENTADWEGENAVVGSLGSLSPMLSAEQITRIAISLIKMMQNTDDRTALDVSARGLVALAPKLSPDQRRLAAESIIAALRRANTSKEVVVGHLLSLLPSLEPEMHQSILTQVLTIILDDTAAVAKQVNSQGSEHPFQLVGVGGAIVTSRPFAQLLQHPACIGEPREWMLQRFEELVLHDGRRVFLKADDEEKSETEKGSQSETQTVEGDHPTRRFLTIHDAADWIQQNWPDFDLEATHPVTWRGEP